jgi:endonuclease/exonuclease/phosphatase family metal-dependent hydrolase
MATISPWHVEAIDGLEVVKLISRNTNGRANPEPQADVVLAQCPDIVVLQEVTARSVAAWIETQASGRSHEVRATVPESSPVRQVPNTYGVLIASHYPLNQHASVGACNP